MRLVNFKRGQQFMAAMAIFVTPVVFLRGVFEAFDLVKATILWILALILLAQMALALRYGAIEPKAKILWPLYSFLLCAIFVTVTSEFPVISLFGQSQRYTGLLTIGACFVVVLTIYSAAEIESLNWYFVALCLSGYFVVTYGLVQETGHDPFPWSIDSFSKPTFSTLGNPNTASAWLSVQTALFFGVYLYVRRERRIIRIALLILLGLSGPVVGAFASFQGQVGVAGVFVVYLLWLLSNTVRRVEAFSALVILLCIVGSSQFLTTTWVIVGSLVVCLAAGSLVWIDNAAIQKEYDFRQTSRRMMWRIVVFACLGIGIIGVALRGTIAQGFREGFVERGDFFRSARDIFFDHLLTGTGLDTFGFFYTKYRPVGHAVNLEAYRSSSAHNLYLGMFSNGGLLLGISYLLLVISVLWVGFRSIPKLKISDPRYFGALAALLSLQVVALVSVEHVALFVLNFTYMGLVVTWVGLAKQRHMTAEVTHRHGRRQRQKVVLKDGPGLVIACACLVFLVVGSVFVTKPFRSARLNFEAQTYLQVDDAYAEVLLSKAARTYPEAAQNWLVLSQLQRNRGAMVEASSSAQETLKRSGYSGSISGLMVSIIFESGEIELAVESSRIARQNDPFAVTLQNQNAEVLLLAAGVVAQSDPESAKSYLDELFREYPEFNDERLAGVMESLNYRRVS